MGRTVTMLPRFCLNWIRPRVRHPAIQAKPEADSTNVHQQEVEKQGNAVEEKLGKGAGRRVMIVVDSSIEAKGALQWALSHTIQSHDTIVLLHVVKAAAQQGIGSATCGDQCSEETAPEAHELVETLKNACRLKKPEVNIETSVVRRKDKGPAIVEEARKQGASLLVLGQRKQSMTWRLLMMWARGSRATAMGGGGGRGVVEYCIQNADCMAIAVRRKSKKLGGYLITTKRQKDFWLLA